PKLEDHDQINQHHRQHKAETEGPEGLAHGLDLPAHLDEVTFRHLGTVSANLIDKLFDVGSNGANVSPAHVHKHVGHACDIVMVDFEGRGGETEFGDVPQRNRHRL